jgi:hypothetical protein
MSDDDVVAFVRTTVERLNGQSRAVNGVVQALSFPYTSFGT